MNHSKYIAIFLAILVMSMTVAFVMAERQPTLIWPRTWDSGVKDYAYDVAVGSDIYVAGNNGTYFLDYDIFLLKYDPDGNLKWSRTWDSGNSDNAFGVAVGSDIYVAGCNVTYTGTAYYGDIILLKYDTSGNFQWSVKWDSGDEDYAYDVAVGSDTDIYVAGVSCIFPSINKNATILKYDPDGNLKWSRTWDSGYSDQVSGVAVGSDIYIAGTIDYGVTRDAFLLKYDPDGNFKWSRIWDSGDDDHAYDVAVGSDIYVACTTGVMDEDALLLKYDPDGNFKWSRIWDSGDDDHVASVAVESNIYVAGDFEFDPNPDNIFLLKYDPSGNLIWTQFYNSGYSMGAQGVAVGSDIYVAGLISYGEDLIDTLLLRYSDTTPVGGYYAIENKFSIIAPYLALIGLIGVFSTILVIRKWRKA